MATLSAEQFQALLATITSTATAAANVTTPDHQPRNDPSALGPMRKCSLGSDKMRKLTLFDEWLEEAENRMEYIGVTSDKEKIILLKTWGGVDITELIKLQQSPLNIKSEDTGHGEAPVDVKYDDLIRHLREYMSKMVNRTMAMHQLLTTQQGSRTWTDFIRDLEKKSKILNFDKRPYTVEEAIKDAAIFGMSDATLKEKALAEDPDLEKLTRWGQARETGREDANYLKINNNIRKLVSQSDAKIINNDEIDDMIDSLQIMKLRKAGKYSGRNKANKSTCHRCNTAHPPDRCPANGKTCFDCGGKNHFARSQVCNKKSVKRVDTEVYSETRTRHSTDGKKWNICQDDTSPSNARRIVTLKKVSKPSNKWVDAKIGDKWQRLFADTGSEFTIISPKDYNVSMGSLQPPDVKLRAWGATDNLPVVGMLNTTIENINGARVESKVYVVDGHQPEPLLGDGDAEQLGFITFNPSGKKPLPDGKVNRIPQAIRENLQVDVITRPPDATPNLSETAKLKDLLDSYKGLVFDDAKVGCMKVPPIHLEYDPDFQPRQPAFRNVPVHYQEEVSKLLAFLRKEGVITDVDPRGNYDCVMNIVVTDKKNGQIRMNIDNTPRNPGMKRTKFHVQTPQEIRHELKEAKVFSEVDMGWGFHQLPLDNASKNKSVFQTHEGLHRMERLYFGPTASSGIFHSEVRKSLAGLNGVTNLHDNILAYGKDHADHFDNLKALLDRCVETGIVLKPSKSTFGLNRIKWFGREFHSNGVTADQDKIANIKDAGRPVDTEEVRSLLMACQFNAKFTFDNKAGTTYEDATAPLRRLLKKDQPFKWGKEEEDAYNLLMDVLNDPATLQPYVLNRPTHVVSDASEHGLQASIYQEKEHNLRNERSIWLPIDHVSRALTPKEMDYSPIERESLALSWGAEQFRYYLVGQEYTAWTDHEPLLSIYNNRLKPTTKRIGRHRDRIQDLQYHLKYLKGERMPCDYGSRHANPIDHLSQEEQEQLGFDVGNDVYVRKIINLGNSPNVLHTEQLSKAAVIDANYQQLIEAINTGKRSPPEGCEVNNKIFTELSVDNGLILRGEKILPPDAPEYAGGINVRTKLLDIAHEGHPGENAMKRYVRSRLWFPGMDREIEKVTQGCLACQAATVTKHRDPLIPTLAPEELWCNLAADHWGPTADGKYLLVVIDELSRYPEVAVVKGTGAEDNVEAFDNIFARHGYCKKLKTDNGPPFNGKENHTLQRYFKWAGIEHQPVYSAEDPEANGLAEAFMKVCRKAWHAALIEGNNPRAELNKTLQLYRATPHPTTGFPPAELLFGRKFRTRLPQLPTPAVRDDITQARTHDYQQKQKQKSQKDKKIYVKPHHVKVSDQVLLKQRSSKSQPPYDPDPYEVTEVTGHQVTAERGDKTITRDAQKWKVFKARDKPCYDNNAVRTEGDLSVDEADIQSQTSDANDHADRSVSNANDVAGSLTGAAEEEEPEIRRSSRERRPPACMKDYG